MISIVIFPLTCFQCTLVLPHAQRTGAGAPGTRRVATLTPRRLAWGAILLLLLSSVVVVVVVIVVVVVVLSLLLVVVVVVALLRLYDYVMYVV